MKVECVEIQRGWGPWRHATGDFRLEIFPEAGEVLECFPGLFCDALHEAEVQGLLPRLSWFPTLFLGSLTNDRFIIECGLYAAFLSPTDPVIQPALELLQQKLSQPRPTIISSHIY